MELNQHTIEWFKKIMVYFVSLIVIFLLLALVANNMAQKNGSSLYLWGCVLFYISIRMLPIAGFLVMLFCVSFGYKKGFIEEYFDHPTRGILEGEDARKLGRNQIVVGVFAFVISLYSGFLDVSVLGDCPEYFYDATWTEVFEKLF